MQIVQCIKVRSSKIHSLRTTIIIIPSYSILNNGTNQKNTYTNMLSLSQNPHNRQQPFGISLVNVIFMILHHSPDLATSDWQPAYHWRAVGTGKHRFDTHRRSAIISRCNRILNANFWATYLKLLMLMFLSTKADGKPFSCKHDS